NQNLTQDFAKAIYNDTPTLKTAEITGRKGDMQINPDGTKTMETGSEKMIYQWDSDLNIITKQTEESKRVGEILKGLKLSDANPEGNSIPDKLHDTQVDIRVVVGEGAFKTAHNFKNRPDLLVLLLRKDRHAHILEKEIKYLEQLDSLGMKTPERYKQITFVDRLHFKHHGLVVQKIQGAEEVRLVHRTETLSPKILNKSNNQTLEEITRLQKIFTKNPNLYVLDFQGLIAEDGQLYVIDPQGVDLHSSSRRNSTQLNALQGVKQNILKHHKRFTDKTLNHITYIDKELWGPPDDTLKQKILNDAKKNNNKVIVVYDSATGEKNIIHEPSGSQSLEFETVEVISRDSISLSAYAKYEYLDFARRHNWKRNHKSVFRVNTAEGYEALNLKSNGKNKYNIILSIGEDKVTKDAANALFEKHPDTSIIATLDEQGKLVFPHGEAFTPDSSVRINIVGHPETLEKVGATKLADYTDQLVQHYKIDSVDTHAYLNRAALVGCKNQALSENYAKQLYTRTYLRHTSVTGRLGDMHINENGSKTMGDRDQKIVHRWNYELEKSTWTTQSSKNIGDVLDRLKLGLDDKTALNTPDTLTHEDIGKPKVSSSYQSNIIIQSSDDPVVIKAANVLFNKHPDTSILVKFDQNGNLVTLKGEAYTPTGDTRVNFVGHGTDFNQEGAQSLADKVKILQQTYGTNNTNIGRIALVGCGTDGVNQNLTQDFAKAIYNDTPELKTAEITGRKGDMQINPDGTKTMETGSKKMIYRWNSDLNIITQQTEESKRMGEILKNLKLGCVSSKDSSDADADAIDIDNIPDTLTDKQVDMGATVGSGSYKTARNFKNQPDLLVLLLESFGQATSIENEVRCLEKLDSLGMKTPKRYKQITFVDEYFNIEQPGLVVQKIKGAYDIRLRRKTYINPQSNVLDNSNNQTLKDIKHLQKIFAKNPNLFVQDFQGLVAEDGQLYIIDPQDVDMNSDSKHNSTHLNILQRFEQTILKRHERFTDKALNHVAYIDNRIWKSYSNARKQQILGNLQKESNKALVAYNFVTGEKEIIHKPSNSQDLDFDTIEVITQDNQNQSVDLRQDCVDFMDQQGWVKSRDAVFRVNTFEDYKALNLKSNGKNKYNIILSIGEDKVTKDAAEALFKKHPDTSVIATLDKQGQLVFPKGKVFTPDSSVRINIVGHPETLEKVGATKLADYTDQLVQHYKIDSLDTHAYLNRAALVGCKNQALSENYAKQLYTRKYLRGASVTGRLGDIQVNEDGSKTMNDKDQKIIHRWNYELEKSTWATQSSKNIGKVLDHLKLGLDDETAFNLPDSLTHEDIGEPINEGSTKVAYILKNHPDLLFLQLNQRLKDAHSVKRLKNEIRWINKFREMGVKTPKYFKVIFMTDENNQKHYGILVERIHDTMITKPGWLPVPEERVTYKTLSDIQNLLQKFNQYPNLSIDDLQMLLGRDGQLYIIDPLNINSPSSKYLSDFSQNERENSIENLQEWRDTSLNTLKEFNQNKGMHAIFVSKEMLDRDPEFEESLLDKAQKQQDLVVMGY
ncbi:hypothetical protein BSPCLSOX_345, partial [uncultured Gammaproteobacteria bacterium]